MNTNEFKQTEGEHTQYFAQQPTAQEVTAGLGTPASFGTTLQEDTVVQTENTEVESLMKDPDSLMKAVGAVRASSKANIENLTAGMEETKRKVMATQDDNLIKLFDNVQNLSLEELQAKKQEIINRKEQINKEIAELLSSNPDLLREIQEVKGRQGSMGW